MISGPFFKNLLHNHIVENTFYGEHILLTNYAGKQRGQGVHSIEGAHSVENTSCGEHILRTNYAGKQRG